MWYRWWCLLIDDEDICAIDTMWFLITVSVCTGNDDDEDGDDDDDDDDHDDHDDHDDDICCWLKMIDIIWQFI